MYLINYPCLLEYRVSRSNRAILEPFLKHF